MLFRSVNYLRLQYHTHVLRHLFVFVQRLRVLIEQFAFLPIYGAKGRTHFPKVAVLGVYRGYQGMIENDFAPLDARSVRNLVNRGGTFLKSARSKEFRTPEGRKKAYENLVAAGADALVVIGGDGSFTGALLFNQEFGFPVMGIPGTIDNDIYGTTYTFGYDTALNTVVSH